MNNHEINFPLVSIVIVTYNSSEFVVETLNSAAAQTYSNIELIVTDDYSKDNTVEICQKWMDANKSRFVSTMLSTSPVNKGIVPNINRGFFATKGKWVKFIAGDDILIETCISDFVDYCLKNPDCKLVYGRVYNMKNNICVEKPLEKIAMVPVNKQKRMIYLGSGLPAPALFIKRELLESFGGFDKRYLFIEDLPMLIKVANNNIPIHFINNFVVKYRIHENNISMNNSKSNFINLRFYADNERVILKDLLPIYIKKLYIGQLLNHLNYILISRLIIAFGNKNNSISKVLNLFIINRTLKRFISKYIKSTNRV